MEAMVYKWGVVRHMEKNHCTFQCSKLTEETLQSEFSVIFQTVLLNLGRVCELLCEQEHRAAIDISS